MAASADSQAPPSSARSSSASSAARSPPRSLCFRLLRLHLVTRSALLPPPPSPPSRAGEYAAALASATPHFLTTTAAPESAAQFYDELAAAAEAFLRGTVRRRARGLKCRCAVVLSAAVAALLAFTQQNVTGPSGKYSPFPFWTSSLDEGWYSNIGGEWDAWASSRLASVGSHVHGKFSHLQFIVFAELLLTCVKSLDPSDCWSISWWLCRLSMAQQNIVDELSSTLFDRVQDYKENTLDHFGELKNVYSYWGPLLCDGEDSYFVSAAFLEAGIADINMAELIIQGCIWIVLKMHVGCFSHSQGFLAFEQYTR
ncbi:hypothetical protein GUJ93_ZPchr0007g5113 [Zizania palustris]|uniref:Uncharacterized protein n=1 Tax=Zizania palustris TaxID=103762 RepID=A0A8J5SUE4_ZIZPA|nr:hypothetical protein GUJ93_ZPchr0007g5113 [Zizania palustris]